MAKETSSAAAASERRRAFVISDAHEDDDCCHDEASTSRGTAARNRGEVGQALVQSGPATHPPPSSSSVSKEPRLATKSRNRGEVGQALVQSGPAKHPPPSSSSVNKESRPAATSRDRGEVGQALVQSGPARHPPPSSSADKTAHRARGCRPAQLLDEPTELNLLSAAEAYSRLLHVKRGVELLWQGSAAVIASPTPAGGLCWRKPLLLARVCGGVVCSCAESRERRQRALASTGPDPSFETCDHVKALELLRISLTESISPSNTTVEALKVFPGFVAVSCHASQLSTAIVRRRPHIKCMDCSSSHCSHTGAYRSSEIGQEDKEREGLTRGGGSGVGEERTRHVPTSSQPRSLPLKVRQASPAQSFSPASENSSPTCPCGSPWSEELVNPPSGRTIAVSRSGVLSPVRLYALRSACGCTKHFDGSSEGVFHGKLGVLVDQGLLADILGSLATATPLASFHKALEGAARASAETSIISLRDLQSIWAGFLSILEPPPKASFLCPTCGPFPDTVVMDGITLGHRKVSASRPPQDEDGGTGVGTERTRHVPTTFQQPSKSGNGYTGVGTERTRQVSTTFQQPLRGSEHQHRIALKSAEARKLLSSFAKSGGDPPTRLLRLLRRDLPELADVVQEAAESPRAERKLFMPLLLDLSKPSPICSLVPAAVSSPVHELIAGRNPCDPGESALWRRLCSDAPALLDRLAPLLRARAEVPATLRALLGRLVPISQAAFAIETRDPALYPAPGREPDSSFFPHWRRLRSLPHYARPTSTNEECNKEKAGHPRLISGILLYFCKHGVCYGYEAMVNPESVAFPFATLFCRFSRAPRVVIYDNACNLHAFFLNREPRFVRKTRIMSDRFHSGNHTACNSGYDLRRSGLHPELRDLNSEAAEQANSRLVRLKPSLSYMSPENFHLHLRLFLSFFNASKMSKS